MSALQKPNVKQAQEGSLAGQLKGALDKWLRENVDDMLPARVVSYDDQANRAVIQPLVMVGTTDGSKISRAQLPNIPVFRYGNDEFFIRFPLKQGAFGWLKACDRDISLIMQAQGRQEDWPNTERLHDFSDSMFVPDAVRGWAISEKNREFPVWQNHDGDVCIALRDEELEIESPRNVSLSGFMEFGVDRMLAERTVVKSGAGGVLTTDGLPPGDNNVAGASGAHRAVKAIVSFPTEMFELFGVIAGGAIVYQTSQRYGAAGSGITPTLVIAGSGVTVSASGIPTASAIIDTVGLP